MKILHYIPDFWSLNNTQAQKMLRLITAVSRQTESYLVTSSPFTKEMEQQLKDVYKLQMVYLPKLSTSNPLKIYHAYKVIKECLMQLQPNLVHVHGSWNPLLFVMERTARRKGYVTCVSIYGGMAPEVLNTEFFKRRLLPLIFYQASKQPEPEEACRDITTSIINGGRCSGIHSGNTCRLPEGYRLIIQELYHTRRGDARGALSYHSHHDGR